MTLPATASPHAVPIAIPVRPSPGIGPQPRASSQVMLIFTAFIKTMTFIPVLVSSGDPQSGVAHGGARQKRRHSPHDPQEARRRQSGQTGQVHRRHDRRCEALHEQKRDSPRLNATAKAWPQNRAASSDRPAPTDRATRAVPPIEAIVNSDPRNQSR